MNKVIEAILHWILHFFSSHQEELEKLLWDMLCEIVHSVKTQWNKKHSSTDNTQPN